MAKPVSNIPENIVRKNLYVARKRKGYSRREVEEAAGMSQGLLLRFEHGRGWITDPSKILIANFLGESVYWLFFQELESTPERRQLLKNNTINPKPTSICQ